MITIRPYADTDFESVAEAYDATWGWELKGSPAENLDVAVCVVANLIFDSNIIYVAEDENGFLGVICARCDVGQTDSTNRLPYFKVMKDAKERLSRTQTGLASLAYYDEHEAMNEMLLKGLQERRVFYECEMRLFLCTPASVGQGIGTKLVNTLFKHLRTQGVKTCMLCTNTTCSWQYYVKTGWTLALEAKWKRPSDIIQQAFVKSV